MSPSNQNQNQNDPPSEGCKICGRDDDHSYLLLCESCNDEYHTYCLSPPIRSVPEGDFYCPNCQKTKQHLKSFCRDDTLDEQVAALPPSFTSRFGEIIWAAGGNGFGWWPACIYDPRLTVGGARKLALKNIGKKHLVYFFGCTDAPFTVLAESKCMNWDMGLLDDFDNGKTAKSMGKTRALMFEWALQAAIAEHDKPIEYRLDWNHEEDPFIVKSGGNGNGNGNGGGAASTNTTSASSNNGEGMGNGNGNSARVSTGTSAAKKKTGTSTARQGNKRSAAAITPSSSSKATSTSIESDSQPPSSSSNNSNANTSASAGKPKPKKAKKGDDAGSQSPKRNSKDKDKDKDKETSPGSNSISTTSSCASPIFFPVRRSNRDRKPSRSLAASPNQSMVKLNRNLVINSKRTGTSGSSPSNSPPSALPPPPLSTPRQKNLFCTILRNDSITKTIATSMGGNDDIMQLVKQHASTRNIGFITIPNRSCTFADARDIMVRDLDQDEDCLPSKFKFFVPNLGPMSIKQERKFGPMLDFLGGADADADGDMSEDEIRRVSEQFGDGSKRNPLKVMVYKFGL